MKPGRHRLHSLPHPDTTENVDVCAQAARGGLSRLAGLQRVCFVFDEVFRFRAYYCPIAKYVAKKLLINLLTFSRHHPFKSRVKGQIRVEYHNNCRNHRKVPREGKDEVSGLNEIENGY